MLLRTQIPQAKLKLRLTVKDDKTEDDDKGNSIVVSEDEVQNVNENAHVNK